MAELFGQANAGGNDGSEAQHDPTTKRRQSFVDRGELPRSAELTHALVLLIALWAIGALSPHMWLTAKRCMLLHLNVHGGSLRVQSSSFFHDLIQSVGGFAAIVVGGAVAIHVTQNRFNIYWNGIAFDLNRLNPLMRNTSIINFRKAAAVLAKVLILGVVLVYNMWGMMQSWQHGNLASQSALLLQLMHRLMWQAALCLLAFGVVHYGAAFMRIEQSMRMTTQQLREEIKEQMGDLQLLRKRRQKMRALVKSRSLGQVKNADVVLVNPTHFAVALAYKRSSMPAPCVVAKGSQLQAERIRFVARRHQIPVISKPALTRSLYKLVPTGSFIPPSLYQAVALVLAHIYQTKSGARQT